MCNFPSLIDYCCLCYKTDNGIQIFHVCSDYWTVATTAQVAKWLMCMILFIPPKLLQAFFVAVSVTLSVQKQTSCNECSLFATANATTIGEVL